MSTDKEIARKIENEAVPQEGHLNTNVMDEILNSSSVLSDKSLASGVQNQLQDAGLLPQLAIDAFSDPNVFKAFAGDNGQISQGKLEQARETGKVDGNEVSATSRFLADALLKRWKDIDTDGRPGISLDELKDWGTNQQEKAPNTGDYHILPFPASDQPITPIARAGFVHDITDGIGDRDYRTPSPEGWKRFTSEKNGVSVFVDESNEFVAKIGPVDKIMVQAEALKVLHDQVGVPVPNFQVYTDVDKNGKPVAVLIMDKVDFDSNQSLTVDVVNPFNKDRDLSKELERQSEKLIEKASKVLKENGFSTDFGNGENWGTKPDALEKIREGKPITMDDLMVIDPVTDKNPIKPVQSFDDFMKNVSPFLKNFTDCHKLWQLVNGTIEMPPLNLGNPARMRGFPRTDEQAEPEATILPQPVQGLPRVHFKPRDGEIKEPEAAPVPVVGERQPRVHFKPREGVVQEPPVTFKPPTGEGPPRVRFKPRDGAQTTEPEATILPVSGEWPPRVRFRPRAEAQPAEPEATILPVVGKVGNPITPEASEQKPPISDANKERPPVVAKENQSYPKWDPERHEWNFGGRMGPPPLRDSVEARDAAWDKLVDRWKDLDGWKNLHLSEGDLRKQVNDGISNAQTARNHADEQMWRDFKADLIKVGLLRPEEPMNKVKVKTIEPPMMRLY